jgi:hypothetical protein
VSPALQSKRSLGEEGRIEQRPGLLEAFESGLGGEKAKIKLGELQVSRWLGSKLPQSAANCLTLKGIGKSPRSFSVCFQRRWLTD